MTVLRRALLWILGLGAPVGLLVLGGASYSSLLGLSYLFDNVRAAHLLFAAGCWISLLLTCALCLIGSAGPGGTLAAPRTLSALLAWLTLVPQLGFALGATVNYTATLAIMLAVADTPGDAVHYLGGREARLSGEIGDLSVTSLTQILEEASVARLELDSIGGFLGAADTLADLVARHGIVTVVRGSCESACVIVALSGAALEVLPSAGFGFHRASAAAGEDSEIGGFVADSATDDMVHRLRGLGVPAPVLAALQDTPAAEMYMLSGQDLIDYGLARPVAD